MLLIGFFQGISMGAGVVIARYFGAKNKEKIECAVHTTVAAGLVSGVLLTLIGYIFAPKILVMMDTPTNVLPNSITYFRIYFMGSLGFMMYNISVGILQAVGDSRHPLYYLIISSVINIVLDILFIAGFHMGVGAAALATIISQFVSAILCLIQLTRSKEVYRLSFKKIRFDMEMLKQIVKIGLPSGVMNSIISIANVVVQSNINAFGEMAMAGCGAYSKIEGFGFLPITSFTMALTTFVGQNLGAKKYDRAQKGARFGIACAVIIAELMGVLIFIFAPTLISAFDSTPEVVAYGVARAKTSSLFFFLLAYSHAISSVLRGAGKSVVPMVVMSVCWCLIRVSVLTIAGRIMPSIQVVYWIYPITWTLSSIVFLIYYKKADWIHAFEK